MDLAVELASGESACGRFVEIIRAGFRVADAHNRTVMRPAQLDTQRVSNFLFGRISLIKKAAILKLGLGEAFAEFGGQLTGNARKEVRAYTSCTLFLRRITVSSHSFSN